MPEYEFQVTIRGTGDDAEEAWVDAVNALASDPGEPESTTLIVDNED